MRLYVKYPNSSNAIGFGVVVPSIWHRIHEPVLTSDKGVIKKTRFGQFEVGRERPLEEVVKL